MLKSTKVILITAGVLVGLGMIVGGIAMLISKAKFGSVAAMYEDSEKTAYERQSVEISGSFKNIDVYEISSDIIFHPTDKSKAYVEFTDGETYKNIVKTEGDTLVIKYQQSRAWYERWNIGIGSIFSDDNYVVEPVDIYLPAAEYDDIKVDVTSGNVKLSPIDCDELEITAVSGGINLDTCNAKDHIKLSSTSGCVFISGCASDKLDVNTVSGDVDLNSSTMKKTDIDTTSGNINVDEFASEQTDIDTTSGDIKGTLLGAYEISFDTVSGDKKVEGESVGGYSFDVDTTSGDLDLACIAK